MPVDSADSFALPSDPHAETVAINFAQTYPDRLLNLGLVKDDFFDRRRRKLWDAMVSVALVGVEMSSGEFVESVIDEITSGDQSARDLTSSTDALSDWLYESWQPESPVRNIDYYVDRIKRCVRARKLIDAAQQIAEHASKVPYESFDVTDASAVLESVAGVPIREELGSELPI